MNHPKNIRLLVVDDNRSIHDDFKKVLCPRQESGRAFSDAEAAMFGDAPHPDPVAAQSFQMESAYQGMDAFEMVKQALQCGQPYPPSSEC